MSFSGRNVEDEALNDSWVDLNTSGDISFGEIQRRSTPIPSLINNAKIEKLLWDAQRESSHSSLVGSSFSSHRESPKSPCSPLAEEQTANELLSSEYFIGQRRQGSTDWIWDWSSRPDQHPPKEWKLSHPVKSRLSFRKSKVIKSGLFSTEMLSVLIISNVVSILLGAGIGLYISRRVGSSILHWAKD